MATPEPKTYPSERAALARVRQLRALGLWPGVQRCGEGRRLLADPDETRAHRASVSDADE